MTGLRPLRVTLLLAATELLEAEVLLRRTCCELLEEGLDVAAEELLRTAWPFWELVAELRVAEPVAELLRVAEPVEELLRVAEPELLRVAEPAEEELLRVTEPEEELLRVAEPELEELLPEVVVPLRTWLDWVGAVADRVEEDVLEERTALEELLRVAEPVEELRVAELPVLL